MSAAVMPMRTTVSALAEEIGAPSSAASAASAAAPARRMNRYSFMTPSLWVTRILFKDHASRRDPRPAAALAAGSKNRQLLGHKLAHKLGRINTWLGGRERQTVTAWQKGGQGSPCSPDALNLTPLCARATPRSPDHCSRLRAAPRRYARPAPGSHTPYCWASGSAPRPGSPPESPRASDGAGRPPS